MTTQQSEEGATRAWEDSVMSCIHSRRDYWCVDVARDARGVRYSVALVGRDDDRPFPAVLDREACASYEEATALATRRNERRATGGTA